MTSRPRIAPGGLRDVGLLAWGVAHGAGRLTGTAPPAIFLVLGRNRRLFRAWLWFAGRLMPGGRLPRRETELVILRVAHLAGSAYEFGQHERLGARAGLTGADIARVQRGPDEPGWTDRERLLLEVTEELHRDRDLDDRTWARLRTVFDEPTCLEVLLLVGHYQMLATTLRTLRLAPDAPRP